MNSIESQIVANRVPRLSDTDSDSRGGEGSPLESDSEPQESRSVLDKSQGVLNSETQSRFNGASTRGLLGQKPGARSAAVSGFRSFSPAARTQAK